MTPSTCRQLVLFLGCSTSTRPRARHELCVCRFQRHSRPTPAILPCLHLKHNHIARAARRSGRHQFQPCSTASSGSVFILFYKTRSHIHYVVSKSHVLSPFSLNWAKVCSPNILRTVRRTVIRFLIELLVRRTWFGQFEEFTCSQLACNEMQASARTCGRRAADSMIENVG